MNVIVRTNGKLDGKKFTQIRQIMPFGDKILWISWVNNDVEVVVKEGTISERKHKILWVGLS